MDRYLNVAMIQMKCSDNKAVNLKHIEQNIDVLMKSFHKPEIIVGVEGGIGLDEPEYIPGPSTDLLCRFAKTYGIYLIPGTIAERCDDLKEGEYYHSAPIINPEGEIIAVYRKLCPFPPTESVVCGKEYCVIDIPEKQTKVGIMLGYEMSFPEISRNLTLMGAEVLIRLASDIDPLYELYKDFPITRAIENQVYFVSVNAVNKAPLGTAFGHSIAASPEGMRIWEGDRTETACTLSLNLDLVRACMEYGLYYKDQLINHIGHFNPPMPYVGNLAEAPLYKGRGERTNG